MVSLITYFLLAAPASAERPAAPQPIEAVRRFEAPRWEVASDMPEARWSLGAGILPDGRVLAFGGGPGGPSALADAALFDPRTGEWSAAAPLPRPMYAVIAGSLKDGRVLAVGGSPEAPGAFIYDPAAARWSPTPGFPAGQVTVVVALDDGGALTASRTEQGKPTDTAFRFDPRKGSWREAGRLHEPRADGRAVVLRGGKVLLCGGFNAERDLSTCELFDPGSGAWSMAASMSRPRFGLTLTLLSDGRVLAAGGKEPAPAELYDPAQDRWTLTRDAIGVRLYHQAALRPDGRVTLVGGYDAKRRLETTDVYDPATDAWRRGPSLNVGRSDFVLVTLEDSKLLAVGGQGNHGPVSAAEVLGAVPAWEGLKPVAPMRAEPVAERPAPPRAAPPAPRYAELDLSGPRRRDGEKDLAVVVGVDRYRALPAADFAERDAASFAAALTGTLGLPEENVIRLIGSRATRTDIAKYIEEWLPRNAEPDSRVYFYFSGHGAPDVKTGAAHLVPWDGDPTFLQSSAYPLDKLYASLAKLPAREVIVVLDSCFSGAGGRSVLAAGTRPLVTRVSLPKPKGRLSILTASAGDEITGSLSGGGHGLFTYHLLEGLGGGADKDADGHIKLSELHGFVKGKVQRAARRQNREQTPQLIAPDPALPVY